MPALSYGPRYPSTPLTLSDFLCNATEKKVQMDLQSEKNAYMIHRVALNNSSFQHTFLGLQDYNSLTRAIHTEESHVKSWMQLLTVRTGHYDDTAAQFEK